MFRQNSAKQNERPNANLVPRAPLSFGQHQDAELWNNQQSRSQSPRVFCFSILILLLFQSQILTSLVFPVRIKCFCGTHPHRLYLWTLFKPRHACAVKSKVLKSWSLEIDYSRAPCLGADQKARGLWKRDCPNASWATEQMVESAGRPSLPNQQKAV